MLTSVGSCKAELVLVIRILCLMKGKNRGNKKRETSVSESYSNLLSVGGGLHSRSAF